MGCWWARVRVYEPSAERLKVYLFSVDFAIPKKDESLVQTYMKYRKLADGKVCCDYALHVGITSWSENVSDVL